MSFCDFTSQLALRPKILKEAFVILGLETGDSCIEVEVCRSFDTSPYVAFFARNTADLSAV